jgi:para-nitrobenzyl esterase
MSHRSITLALVLSALALSTTACTDTENKDGYIAPGGSGGASASGTGGMGGAGGTGGASGMMGGMAGEAGMGGAGGMMAPMLGPLEVQTDKGVVRGASMDGVRIYKGIPYAAPPTGENRFKAPQPAAAWTETLVAAQPGNVCPQVSPSTRMFAGAEDCLFLNVFAPDPMPAEPLPVMVWLHGGAYVFGSGSDESYNGSHLVKRGNVVIVTLNYRLGALGYLAHEGLSSSDASMASGNYGLLDQRAALQWVKANIAGFGGNADNVTIFGESAGGRSVCWHLVAPGSAGLFHRAIVESGYCMKPTYARAEAEAQGGRFATALGCTDPLMATTCLRSKTPEEIVMASQGSATPSPGGIFYQDRSAGFAFEPTIDGVNITGQLADLLAGGGAAAVPVLQGANTDEGILFHVAVLGNVTPVMTEEEYLAALTVRYGAENAALIVAQYPVADFMDDPNAAISAVSGDGTFLCPARQAAKLLSARAGASTYLYNFGVPLDVNPALPALANLVFHSAELPFVWGNPYALGMVPAAAQPAADALQDYFLQFARTGDPNTATSAVQWPVYAADDTLLSFGAMIAPVPTHKKEECDFWETVVPLQQP